ncbi:MAG: hypothetical protein JWO80_1147, partial [Bryobacterales bacterium]|nr:hypothetical protein [Bryobacterales bacterium]
MIRRSSLLLLLLLATWLPAAAQDSRGSISGRAVDQSGSSVTGVQVRATNTGTGASVDAETNDSGNYTLPFLLPGIYNVTAELTGFQKLERKGVEVRVNDSVTVD